MSRTYAIQAGALRENPSSGPDGVGVQADIAYTLEARAEVQAVCGYATPLPANDNAPVAAATGSGLRFLSVCSGIEAASVAWHPLGWRAVAFSEIEKFPSQVLAHHYPDVPNLGDLTKVDTKKLGRVDVLAGGTPCQAFSVAGLRQGLEDARGNLTLKFVELAHELADGNGLRNVVWENVVGVLSDKGNAFGCFLAGLVGADAPIVPPGRWTNAGMVSGPRGRAAWRVLDAQYFGVAQRRRRVIVVADFGGGADPAAVLLIEQGLPRHPPTRGEAGEKPAPTISARTKGGGGLGTDFDLDGGLRVHAVDVAPCLRAGGNSTGGDRPYGTDVDTADSLIAYAPEIARCVATREGSSQDYESTTMVAFAENSRAELRLEGGDGQTVGTIGVGGGKPGQGYPAVAFQSSQSGVRVGEVHATLDSNNGSRRHNGTIHGSAVRRLTPMECERLQGFPDGYTRIPLRAYGKKSVTRTRPDDMWEFIDGKWWLMSADGPRYKALGNSWAVPKFVWLGKRISALMPKEKPAAANDNDGVRDEKAA